MNLKETLHNFNELVMFKHTIFSIPFIMIAMVVSAQGWFGFTLLGLGLLAAVTARNFAMAFNRFIDRKYDKDNPRTASRPSVDGRISGNQMFLFLVVNAVAFIVVSFFINDLAFKLAFPFLIILGAYSYFKRFSFLAHLFLGLALGLAPIAGAIAVLGDVPLWTYLLSIGVMFWVAGFDLLYALQDMEYDKSVGLHSIPARFGLEGTLKISRGFHFLTGLFWFAFALTAPVGILTIVAVTLASATLFWEQYVVTKGLENINRAFFTANGYLGIVFLILVILDFLWM